MKKILLSALFIMTALCRVQAQEIETHVKVHCGETPLENLLTEEQKKSVTYLTVTGTLLDEDYAFLRNGLINQLDTLDLKDSEIDTISDYAFSERNRFFFCLILPRNIEYLGNGTLKALSHCNLIVTGNYPYFGNQGQYSMCTIKASDDNISCTNILQGEEFPYLSVYSQDKKTLYYINTPPHERECSDFEIMEGTKLIHGTAFRNAYLPWQFSLTIPESMDSIGDYVFKDIDVAIPTGYRVSFPDNTEIRLICKRQEPPALGKDVFGGNFWIYGCLYVPKASIEKYRNAPGYGDAHEIYAIEDIGNSILENKTTPEVIVQKEIDSYVIKASLDIQSVVCYDITGRLLSTQTGTGKSAIIRRDNIPVPYTLAHIHFANGTTETVKLIP